MIRSDGSDDHVILRQDEAYVSGWVGERILFVAKTGSTSDVYSMSLDGSDVRRLTYDPVNAKGAYGSANDRLIVFNSARDGNDEIYLMNADGSGQTRLTFNSSNDYQAAWGP